MACRWARCGCRSCRPPCCSTCSGAMPPSAPMPTPVSPPARPPAPTRRRRAAWARARVPRLGKLFGIQHAMKGGIGSASITVAGVTVAALVAANPVGDVRDPASRLHRRRITLRRWARAARHHRIAGGGRPAGVDAGRRQHHDRHRRHRRHADQGRMRAPGHHGARRPGALHRPGAHAIRRRHAVRAGHRHFIVARAPHWRRWAHWPRR